MSDRQPPDAHQICFVLEQISENLVLAELSDLSELAQIHTHLEEVGAWAVTHERKCLASGAYAAARLLESIILNQEQNAEEALASVGQAVSTLVAAIRDHRPDRELVFPEKLRLDTVELEQSGDSTEPSSASALLHPEGKLPSQVSEDVFAEFIDRHTSDLGDLEHKLIILEENGDSHALGQTQRYFHTLKGEAALLGLDEIEQLCHAVEDVLTPERVQTAADALLEVKDWLLRAIGSYAGHGTHPGPVGAVIGKLQPPHPVGQYAADAAPDHAEETTRPGTASEPEVSEVAADAAEETAPPSSAFEGDVELVGEFIPEAREHLESADMQLLTLETEPRNEDAINALFRAFHTIKGVAGSLGLGAIESLAHTAENLLDLVRKGERCFDAAAIDVSFDSVDVLKALIDHLEESLAAGTAPTSDDRVPDLVQRIQAVIDQQEPEHRIEKPENAEAGPTQTSRLGEILVESGKMTEEAIEKTLKNQQAQGHQRKLGEMLVESGQVKAKDIGQALRSQRTASSQKVEIKETVKVDADRLDQLVTTIGELVIAESMVSQSSELRAVQSTGLQSRLSQLNKITRELQEMGMALRMVPLRATFQRMARLVRDLGKKSGKKVNFAIAGEDTELDKSVVDRIGDPLVHLVRNAVDHGLEETPADRVAAGKDETGQVELKAFHKEGKIHIEINDDGRGLDKEAILEKARERGVIGAEDQLRDRDIYNLIFQPGFSTAKQVSEVSGRGVGMDVVKRNIEELRGQVDIRTETGKGSTFTIILPLTLAIIDGMVVRVGNEQYIIPTLSIETSIRPEPDDISSVLKRGEMLMVQGEMLPLFRLSELFNIGQATHDPTEGIVVVLRDDLTRAGLLIDELLGQQQVVIKTLGETMENIPGVSGGAIMPNGHVGLILDIGGIVKLAHHAASAPSAGPPTGAARGIPHSVST